MIFIGYGLLALGLVSYIASHFSSASGAFTIRYVAAGVAMLGVLILYSNGVSLRPPRN
jgi:hypothetical protein